MLAFKTLVLEDPILVLALGTYIYAIILMSGKQFWLYKFLQLKVSDSSYASGLFGLNGLEIAKYGNHDIIDIKLTPKHQKILI